MAIEGKIARILDEGHVVITVGRAQGVKEGTKFTVFATGDVVPDPESGEPLERWEFPKGRIITIHAQEKISICTSVSKESEQKTEVDPSTQTLSADMIYVSRRRAQRGEAEAAKLNVNKSQIEGMPQIGPISVGDLVRSEEDL